MITGYNESTLSSSEVYSGINNIGGNTNVTTNKAIKLINGAKKLANTDIEAGYIAVKQITDSLTRAALKAYDNDEIVLLYNNVPELSVTQALPFITFKSKSSGKYITYVFMDKYITVNRDGVMTVQPSILRDLLTGALISNGLKKNYNIMAANSYLQKILSNLYAQFVLRILNRQYAIMADKVALDTLQYWIEKFFLQNILAANDSAENIELIAKAHFKHIDELKYAEIKKLYENASPIKFSELLELLKNASPRMKSLNMRIFLSDWINYYYAPSMLAIDNMEYLIFMILTLMSGNNIISVSASDIVKEAKNIKGLRTELIKLI